MPEDKYTEAMREALASAKSSKVQFDTFEISQPPFTLSGPDNDKIDVAFLVSLASPNNYPWYLTQDEYFNHGGRLESIRQILPNLMAKLSLAYNQARFALVFSGQFDPNNDRRENNSIGPTGENMAPPVVVEDFSIDSFFITNALRKESLEERFPDVYWENFYQNGEPKYWFYGPIFLWNKSVHLAAETLSWDPDARKFIFVLNGATSDNNTENNFNVSVQDAVDAVNNLGATVLSAGPFPDRAATNFDDIPGPFRCNPPYGTYPNLDEFYVQAEQSVWIDSAYSILTQTETITIDSGLGTHYLIVSLHDRQLQLEEGGDLVNFTACAVSYSLPQQNEGSVSAIDISIDNVDKRIGDFINEASKYNAPILVTYRPYLEDSTVPQMDPLVLTLSDITITPFDVSGRAYTADIPNATFLNQDYTRRRFPGLGNS